MEKEAILHIPLSQFAFAEKEDRLVIRIRCKKGDLKRCVLLWGDRVAMEEPLPVKQSEMEHVASDMLYDYYEVKIATVYKGNIIKNLIMDCQSYTKYRPNETTGGIFVSWRRKEELPTGA